MHTLFSHIFVNILNTLCPPKMLGKPLILVSIFVPVEPMMHVKSNHRWRCCDYSSCRGRHAKNETRTNI